MQNQKPKKIMTGAIFEDDPKSYPQKIANLNSNLNWWDVAKVRELYGSLQTSFLPTARPDFRLPNVSTDYLERYVAECHKHGISFNYTMNSNYAGDLENISHDYERIVNNLKVLENRVGVDRITVAHPILLDIVCKNTKIPVEISTIMNVSSLQAPAELKKRYPNVNKICLGIDKVRNVGFISKMQKVCAENGIELEVMVSEFCAIGLMSCTNLHRNTCYNMHSMNMPEQVARQGINEDGSKQPDGVKGYPWSSGKTGCIFGRGIAPEAWLGTRTIWPNDLRMYLAVTGVECVKITNRTAPPEFALQLTEYYCKGEYNGLLAGLWLALPASLQSARERFDELQKAGAEAVPYICEDLSQFTLIDAMLPHGISFRGRGNFMTPFFELPDIDWNDVVWVDKPNEECKSYESNWIHRWHQLLTNKKQKQ